MKVFVFLNFLYKNLHFNGTVSFLTCFSVDCQKPRELLVLWLSRGDTNAARFECTNTRSDTKVSGLRFENREKGVQKK